MNIYCGKLVNIKKEFTVLESGYLQSLTHNENFKLCKSNPALKQYCTPTLQTPALMKSSHWL